MPPGAAGPTGGGIPAGVAQTNANADAGHRDEEYVPEFPHGLGGQPELGAGNQPMMNNAGLADIIRRTIRGGLTNTDLEGVNRSPFTRDIRMARNPPDFKLPLVYNIDTTEIGL